ncbi:MAG TPA: ATP-binding protein, partial [Thermoanaerobaculia bacterium]|nr:ATP-binding protein [Thermoanaerobaculia bacterium]
MFDLAATLERYRHIVENADEIIFRADVSGNFTYVNPAAERLTGYAREELIGRSYLSLIDPEYRGAAEHFYHRQFRTRTRSSYFEFPMLARTGARVWLGQSVLTVFDADGRIEGYEAIARDITYRRGIEEELARTRDAALQSARAKAEFLANVSHEIRTPLNGVLGLADLLLGTGLSPEQREYANGIRASAETLLSIVNDVLDLARVEAGKLAIEAVDFDLEDLLDSVSEQFATRFAEKGIRFRLAVDDDIPRALRGDSNRIRQVLLNLVGNALKFTERGEIALTLRIAAHDGQNLRLRFVVTDTGIGIPTTVQGRLFRPFTQADGSTSRRFGGSGLGLAVCKRLVKAMNGEIGVMSVEGAGSTFWFEVPLVRQSDAEAARLRRWDLSRYRALLVDGNDVHRQMIARHLASARLAYDEAADAAEALAAVRAKRYDVVVFDLVLPRDDGLNLARAMRSDPALEGIRLLLITAFGRRQNDVLAYRAAGIDAFLLKPIRRTQLCDALSRLLQDEGTAEAAVPVTPETAPALHARVLLVEDNIVNQTVARGQLHRLGHDSVIVSSGVEALK